MKFDGDIIITDPCYLIPGQNNLDWEKCQYGDDMGILGFTTYLVSPTGVGDWSCIAYLRIDGEPLGEFCADAGLVGVFLLDEVLKYNPAFDLHINKPWTTTWIPDFHGEVEIEKKIDKKNKTTYVSIVGKGNIDFFTDWTGF